MHTQKLKESNAIARNCFFIRFVLLLHAVDKRIIANGLIEEPIRAKLIP